MEEGKLAAKGESVQAADFQAMANDLAELGRERDLLKSELAAERGESERLRAELQEGGVVARQVASTGSKPSAEGDCYFDAEDTVRILEEFLAEEEFTRVKPDKHINVYGWSVYIGLTKESWKSHPDRTEALEDMKTRERVVLFSGATDVPAMPPHIVLAQKELSLQSVQTFLEEVMKEEEASA